MVVIAPFGGLSCLSSAISLPLVSPRSCTCMEAVTVKDRSIRVGENHSMVFSLFFLVDMRPTLRATSAIEDIFSFLFCYQSRVLCFTSTAHAHDVLLFVQQANSPHPPTGEGPKVPLQSSCWYRKPGKHTPLLELPSCGRWWSALLCPLVLTHSAGGKGSFRLASCHGIIMENWSCRRDGLCKGSRSALRQLRSATCDVRRFLWRVSITC